MTVERGAGGFGIDIQGGENDEQIQHSGTFKNDELMKAQEINEYLKFEIMQLKSLKT